MKLARLILHFNTPKLTEALCRMVPDAIVIDNGSDKAPYVGKNRCIKQENLGFTAGWNAGIRAVYDEYDGFWLMNSDIQVTPASVARVQQLFDERPDLLIWTPAYNCWMKDAQPKSGAGLKEIGAIEFTAPIIRKELIERIGWFDELFARGYGVEFDYCYRARRAGVKIWVDHASKFYHLGQQTISKHEGLLSYSRKANLELTSGLMQKYGSNYKALIFKGLNIKTDFAMRIAVYTTLFGGYDQLKAVPEQEIKADYFVVTDDPELKAEGWKTIVPTFPRKQLGSRLRAKFFKLFPWELNELRPYDLTIYIDASIRVTAPNFISQCVKNLRNDLLLFKHPSRNCIYKEAEHSLACTRKYNDEPISEQLDFYKHFVKPNSGLYAGGVLVRKHTPLVKKMMSDWWFENIKFSFQDQLSLPVVFAANNFKPSVFAESQYKNDFLKVEWHDDPVAGTKSVFDFLETDEYKQKKAEAASGERQVASGECEVSSDVDALDDEFMQTDLTAKKAPFFTVLMPVWKTSPELLTRAITSIRNQTFSDFKLLIIDDNNDPESETGMWLKALVSLEESPDYDFEFIRTTENKGLAAALDFGIEHVDSPFIVRMDSDDIAKPNLLQKHFDYLQKHIDARVVGVQISKVKDGKVTGYSRHPANVSKETVLRSGSRWFLNHPGVCLHTETIRSVGGYGDTPANMPEDYVLWCKLLGQGFVIHNLSNRLIDYTVGDGSHLGQDRQGKAWKQFLIDTREKYLQR